MPTQKQKAATARNWRIYRLRALYHSFGPLDEQLAEVGKALVNTQLIVLGAEPEGAREAARRKQWMEEPA